MIQPKVEICEEKVLIGMSTTMAMADNKTFGLFHKFMQRRKEIRDISSNDVYDVRLFGRAYLNDFSPHTNFVKWAAVEVSQIVNIPAEMNIIHIPTGLYAIFKIVGMDANPTLFEYIFTEWLPASGYQLDERPHFHRLSESYQSKAADSLQEIYVPIIQTEKINLL